MPSKVAEAGKVKADDLEEYNPLIMSPDPSFTVFFGPPNSGKNNSMLNWTHLMFPRWWDHLVILVSPTAEHHPEQYKWIPKEYQRTDLSQIPQILAEIIIYQKNQIDLNDAQIKGSGFGSGDSKDKKKGKSAKRGSRAFDQRGTSSTGAKGVLGGGMSNPSGQAGGDSSGSKKRKRKAESKDSKSEGKGGEEKKKKGESTADHLMSEHKRQTEQMAQERRLALIRNRNRAPEEAMKRFDADKMVGDPNTTIAQCSKILLIMDDVSAADAMRYATEIKNLANNYRHLKIDVMMCIHGSRGGNSIPPALRENITTAVLCKRYRAEQAVKFWAQEYMSCSYAANSKSVALSLIEDVSQVEYRNLVVDMRVNASRLQDCCFTFGPCPEEFPFPDFRIGLKEQWNDESGASTSTEGYREQKDYSAIGHKQLDDRVGLSITPEPNFFQRNRFMATRGLQERIQDGNFSAGGVVPTRNYQGWSFDMKMRKGKEPQRLAWPKQTNSQVGRR
jgi:hypothetical protein